tara:strand:- start:274 stop:447 length:174 start_codon:yes stop_codon:yes gene_type:complete
MNKKRGKKKEAKAIIFTYLNLTNKNPSCRQRKRKKNHANQPETGNIYYTKKKKRKKV